MSLNLLLYFNRIDKKKFTLGRSEYTLTRVETFTLQNLRLLSKYLY